MRPFHKALAAIALLALAIRVAYAFRIRGYPVQGDAMTFHLVAQGLADGRGFVEALPPHGPTAEHPPMIELFLAALDKLGGNGFLVHRLALGCVGTLNVVLIGLLGRRIAPRAAALRQPAPRAGLPQVGGMKVGLVAAAIAAVYPLLWTADGALMSETLYGTFLLGALLAALWLAEAPSWRRAAALGALIGLAALTRGEAIALVVLLALPLAWRGGAGRWVRMAAALAAFAVVLAPWTIRNLTTFDTPVLISTNSNGVFVGANCPATYHGSLIGFWRYQCYTPRRPGEGEAAYFARQRRIGLDYARDHADRWPVVILARLGRELDVFRVGQSLYFNAGEGRPANYVRWGIRVYWVVGLLALAGIALLARRRGEEAPHERPAPGEPPLAGRDARLWVLLAPIVMVLAVAVVTYGTTRFRYAAEPSLIVLAAVTLVAAFERVVRAPARPPALRA